MKISDDQLKYFALATLVIVSLLLISKIFTSQQVVYSSGAGNRTTGETAEIKAVFSLPWKKKAAAATTTPAPVVVETSTVKA